MRAGAAGPRDGAVEHIEGVGALGDKVDHAVVPCPPEVESQPRSTSVPAPQRFSLSPTKLRSQPRTSSVPARTGVAFLEEAVDLRL